MIQSNRIQTGLITEQCLSVPNTKESYHRPRTRRKSASSDILGEEIVYTFSPLLPCHGKTEMCNIVPRWNRVSILFGILIAILLLNCVSCCNVDPCWGAYQIASERCYSSDRSDGRCTALRTYMKCVVDLHGCKGNIKFHSVKKVIRNQMTQHKCTSDGPVCPAGTTHTPPPPPDAVCTYQGKRVYKHCGLFGDPHLRTFEGQLQTCRVEGAWPLISNQHLTVQVTNDPVSTTVGATATSKLTVIITRNTDCAADTYIMYQAQSDVLPSTFNDGQTVYGKSHSVQLIEVDPGKHVEIRLKYIDTIIKVRQVGRYLTFSIRMPEELVNSTNDNGLQLCMRGCPRSEIIDYKNFLSIKEKQISNIQTEMSRDEAEKLCRKVQLADFYLDSCVFDLMMTGNENFTLSAFAALQDVLKLDPEYIKSQPNRTTLQIYDSGVVCNHRTSAEVLRISILVTLMSCFLTHLATRS